MENDKAEKILSKIEKIQYAITNFSLDLLIVTKGIYIIP